MEPKWLTLARTQIGIVEGAGAKNDARVLKYYSDAAHPEIHADSVPWCAAFVGAMLKRAGIKPSMSLAARSYENWGQPCKGPVLGCVGVKKRGNSGWQGHVGFVVGANDTTIFMLGGNQNDAVNIAGHKRSDFTAFRWPANIPIVVASLPSSLKAAKDVREA